MGTALLALVVAGCAHTPRVDEAKLGQLPIQSKQAIFTAQHNISVAEANRASADRALDQAKSFRDISEKQVDAANSHFDAAQKALELAAKSNDAQMRRAALETRDMANKELVASRAKLDYAKRLVDLREEETKVANDRVDASRAELALVEAESLQRNNIEPGVNVADVRKSHAEAQAKTMQDEGKVAQLRDEAQALRTAWIQQRRAYNIAQRGTTLPIMRAPRDADQVPTVEVPQVQPARPPAEQQQVPQAQPPSEQPQLHQLAPTPQPTPQREGQPSDQSTTEQPPSTM